MYTKEELLSKKYTELLKIVKSLGVSCGRKKTAKVVELILEAQDEAEDENKENSMIVASQTQDQDVTDSPSGPKRRSLITRSGKRIITNPSPSPSLSLENSSLESSSPKAAEIVRNSLSPSSSKKRSPLTVLEVPKRSPSVSPKERKRSLNRSDTFTEVSPKRRSPRLEPVAENEVSNHNVDLECKEFQTVEDIEMLENISATENILVDSPQNSSPSRIKKPGRRSLRGQLLEVRATHAFRKSLSGVKITHVDAPSVPSEPGPEPPVQNKVEPVPPVEKPLGKKELKESSQKGNDKKGKAASSIPRFVSYARAIKIPNFAKIHQKAADKLEAIDEYVERKQNKLESIKKDPLKKKQLSSSKLDSVQKGVKKSPVLSAKRNLKMQRSPFSLKNNERKSVDAADSKRKSHIFTPNPNPKTSGLPKLIKENLPPSEKDMNSTFTKPQPSPKDTPGSFFRRKAYVPTSGLNRSTSFRSSIRSSPSPAASKVTRVPKAGNAKERFKKMVQKQPNVKSSSELRTSQKAFIKGVRTNRRFQLQMANRGINI